MPSSSVWLKSNFRKPPERIVGPVIQKGMAGQLSQRTSGPDSKEIVMNAPSHSKQKFMTSLHKAPRTKGIRRQGSFTLH
jgi:hypothetical protein